MKRIFLVFACILLAALLAAEVTYIDSLRQRADAGDAEAQYNLGVCYNYGALVVQDYKVAVSWYRLAAGQGYASAQNSLGNRYYNGEGVSQDYAEAVKWYRLAANQGDAFAQNNLGACYYNGEGVPQDYGEVYFWWLLAAANGDDFAKEHRDIAAKELTPQRRGEIQARATKWFEEHQ